MWACDMCTWIRDVCVRAFGHACGCMHVYGVSTGTIVCACVRADVGGVSACMTNRGCDIMITTTVTHIGLSSSNQTQLVQIDTGSSDLLVAQASSSLITARSRDCSPLTLHARASRPRPIHSPNDAPDVEWMHRLSQAGVCVRSCLVPHCGVRQLYQRSICV